METLGLEPAQEKEIEIFERADWLAAQEALRFDGSRQARDSRQFMSDLTYLAANGNETASTLLGEAIKNAPWTAEADLALSGLEKQICDTHPGVSEELSEQIGDILATVWSERTEEEALSAISDIKGKTARMVGFNLLSQKIKQRIK